MPAMMSKPKFSTFSSLNVDKKGHISSKIQWSAFFIKLMCAIEFQNERKDEKYFFNVLLTLENNM